MEGRNRDRRMEGEKKEGKKEKGRGVRWLPDSTGVNARGPPPPLPGSVLELVGPVSVCCD